jgi:carbamoyltransferase
VTAILGISALYHDAAAALLVDGVVVAAAQEERFTRKRHDARMPSSAIEYCLREAGLEARDLDWVAFYDKPLRKLERLLETYVAFAPRGFRSFSLALPAWVQEKLFVPREIARALGGRPRRPIVYAEHHESHAASAFYPSPFDEAALLTMDGVGEWATASLGTGRGSRIELTHVLDFPHSLGLLYSAFTYYCGFKVNSGEYKLMGLAPYGEPRFAPLIRERLVDVKEDGSFRLDLSYFDYCAGLTMTSRRFHELFGGPPRREDEPLRQAHMDLAASIQVVTEEIVLRAAQHLRRTTGLRQLCMAGGVALNCVANGRLLREGVFDDVWVQPAAGDAGGALGAAQLVHHQLLGGARRPGGRDTQRASLLGPAFPDDEIAKVLASRGASWTRHDDDASLCAEVARMLADGKVVGWMSGRMEFGPRALGSRSILGDARSPKMQSVMNLKIKGRESFRPFAPVVLRERAHEWFEVPKGTDWPYMMFTAQVAPSRRIAEPEHARGLEGIAKLAVPRSTIPAVTHVDGSARIQTVDAERHGRLERLLREFETLTGCPVLINTSFNVRGEPIVCTPDEAWRCFRATGMDALVIERHVLKAEDQPPLAAGEAERFRAAFGKD